ncbi:hypothetical protein KBB05_04515 [Patescibacteria group bacterium]|nr:hypothetical protein [Patescibacteria group bacterium]
MYTISVISQSFAVGDDLLGGFVVLSKSYKILFFDNRFKFNNESFGCFGSYTWDALEKSHIHCFYRLLKECNITVGQLKCCFGSYAIDLIHLYKQDLPLVIISRKVLYRLGVIVNQRKEKIDSLFLFTSILHLHSYQII